MSIKTNTRKILWARSGNRCAICKKQLVQKTKTGNYNIVGHECHIVGQKEKGPRGGNEEMIDIDGYDNLILLCANHHNVVDNQENEWPIDKLQQLKEKHEAWVRNTLALDIITPTFKGITLLPRITSGKDLINIVFSSSIFQFDYDEPKNEDEIKIIGGFFNELKGWGDLYKVGDIEKEEELQIVFRYSKELQVLDNYGFMLFGESRKVRLRNSNDDDMGIYNKATFNLVRKDSSTIIDVDKWNKRLEVIKKQVDEFLKNKQSN